MGMDFIRYYIGDISIVTLQRIQKESGKFDDWILISGSDFKYSDSYGYEQIENTHEKWIELLRGRSVIAENREPNNIEDSFIWLNASRMADILILLSIARAKYYPRLLFEKNLGDNYSFQIGLITREEPGNRDIVEISNLGQFISEALTFIERNRNWLKDSAFVPSIYWYTQAQQSFGIAPSILEMALYWVSIEIVAGNYIDGNRLGITSKKQRVKRFIEDRGYTGVTWNFLDQVVDDWYQTRCAAFHEGEETLPIGVLTTRRQQVRDFVSLVLVEMLQQQEDTKKKEIAARIQIY